MYFCSKKGGTEKYNSILLKVTKTNTQARRLGFFVCLFLVLGGVRSVGFFVCLWFFVVCGVFVSALHSPAISCPI